MLRANSLSVVPPKFRDKLCSHQVRAIHITDTISYDNGGSPLNPTNHFGSKLRDCFNIPIVKIRTNHLLSEQYNYIYYFSSSPLLLISVMVSLNLVFVKCDFKLLNSTLDFISLILPIQLCFYLRIFSLSNMLLIKQGGQHCQLNCIFHELVHINLLLDHHLLFSFNIHKT